MSHQMIEKELKNEFSEPDLQKLALSLFRSTSPSEREELIEEFNKERAEDD